MCLSLETLTSIIRTGLPILVELIDLVICYNFLKSQTTLHRLFTSLLAFQTDFELAFLYDFQYGFKSSRLTADLLTIVSDRIARAFNRSGATRA